MRTPMLSRLPTRLRACLFGLIVSHDGVAAVEFALVLPVMVTMLLGVTEVTLGVTTDRKLTQLSRTLADLAGRAQTMSKTDVTSIFSAGSIVMQPYDSSSVKMVLSSITVTTVNSKPVGTVAWSCAQGPSAVKRSTGSSYTVPTGYASASSFIVAETSMPYTPMFGYTFTGVITLTETTPWPVRNAASVAWSGSAC